MHTAKMPTTKIQILSDLHLEMPTGSSLTSYTRFDIIPRAPHLALLGDIGTVSTQDPISGDFATFLRRQLTHFDTIFFIPGNHEPYDSSWHEVNVFFERFQASLPEFRTVMEHAGEEIGEFVFLNKGRYDFGEREGEEEGEGKGEEGVTVLGCTLFSKIEPREFQQMKLGLNDFHKTKGWSPRQHSGAHKRNLEWLNEQVGMLEGTGRKVVVLTHHSPTMDERAVEPRHKGSTFQSGFMTDLSAEKCWKSKDVKVWAFGHTHYNCDFVDEFGKRVVTNQKGYAFDGEGVEGYDVDKVIEV